MKASYVMEQLPKITLTPLERGQKVTKRIKKMLGMYTDQQSLEEIHLAITNEIEMAINEDRKIKQEFINIVEKKGSIAAYYITVLEKASLLAGGALVENNRKKKEEMILDIFKLLNANIVNGSTPVPVIINSSIEEKVA